MLLRLITPFLIAFLFISCNKESNLMFKKSTVLMNTLITITVVSDSAENAERAINAAFGEIKRLEGLLSFWDDKSEISLINKNAGVSAVKISPDTLEIIDRALYISEKTGGAFDATIGPVIRLWDFNKKTIPSDESVKTAIIRVAFREMQLDKTNSTAFLKNKEMSFDTGGIAKGFAADKAVAALKASGIKSGLVSVAGDIKAFGMKPDKDDPFWHVGLRNPRSDDKDEIIATLNLNDEAVSTSGDYERYFIKEGVRYHHIIDPKTGYPAQGSMSVTVIAKDGVLTDGLSTGVFVLGPEKGIKLIEELGMNGIIISSEGKKFVTDGIKNKIIWKEGR